MVIKAFITRKVKPDRMHDAFRFLTRIRYGAMRAKGYVGSETLSRYSDPTEVLVASMWHSIEDWEKWRTSTERIKLSEEFSEIMIGDEKIDLYEMGIIQDFFE